MSFVLLKESVLCGLDLSFISTIAFGEGTSSSILLNLTIRFSFLSTFFNIGSGIVCFILVGFRLTVHPFNQILLLSHSSSKKLPCSSASPPKLRRSDNSNGIGAIVNPLTIFFSLKMNSSFVGIKKRFA